MKYSEIEPICEECDNPASYCICEVLELEFDKYIDRWLEGQNK